MGAIFDNGTDPLGNFTGVSVEPPASKPNIADRIQDANNALRARANTNARQNEESRMASDQNDSTGPQRYGMQVNSNYLARIVQNGVVVAKGFLPETFQVSVSSSFGMPFGQGIPGKQAFQQLLKIVGHTTLISQSMTMQVWEGSQPLELSLELEFLAESDPQTEVIDPIKRLLKLVMPKKTNRAGRLEPPGPQLEWGKILKGTVAEALGTVTGSDAADQLGDTLRTAADSASGKISIYIGNFLKFDSVVVESVNQTYHSMFDEKGLPLRATVSVIFKTFLVPAQSDNADEDDIERLFNRQTNNGEYPTMGNGENIGT